MAARLPKPQRVNTSRLPLPGSYASLRAVWDDLDRYRVVPRTHGYPDNLVRLWAPVDAVHQAIVACVTQSQVSVCSSMYSWNDKEVNELFQDKLRVERIFVQLSLDSTQGYGPAEVPLLKTWHADEIGNSVSIGHSPFGGISHIKEFVLDGVLTIGGSTNLSVGGEGFDPKGKGAQNNECYFCWDPVYAAETRARLDIIHDEQLSQMAAGRQKLLLDWTAKRTTLTSAERAKLKAGLIPA